jgi:putative ABC transport system permease protein
MSMRRQLARGLRALFRRTAADRDIHDEVEHYLDLAATEFEAGGLSRDEARMAARRELGSRTSVREQVRSAGWETRLETAFAEVRQGARGLRRSPGFAMVSAITVALGIAASTSIFSAAKPILVDGLPYPDADRLAIIWDRQGGEPLDVTFGTYREVVERSRSFQALAVMRPWQPTLSGADEPERLDGQMVSAGYFRVLGIAPAIGRDFQPADDVPGAAPNVIISDGLWRRRLGADIAAIGRPLTLDGRAFIVVGVMPATFENVLAPSTDIWRPLQYDRALPPNGREWGHHLRMVGRLRPNTTLEDAVDELSLLAKTPLTEFARMPWASLRDGFIVTPLHDEITSGIKPAVAAVMAASLLLLLIASVNVINLGIARSIERRGELATRAALGAPRSRLLRGLLIEALLVATAGGALGVALAYVVVDVIVSMSPAGLPRIDAVRVDGAALAFAAAVSIGVGVVCALIPGFYALRDRRGLAAGQTSSRVLSGHQVVRRTLVAAEVALALVLLVGAGLLVRTVQQLLAVPPGFRAENVMTVQVQAAGRQFADGDTTRRFFTEVLDRVRQIPDVSAAAFAGQLPLTGDMELWGVHFQSSPTQRDGEDRSAQRYAVSAGYFDVMGIPLLRGRVLDERDTDNAPLAAVLSAGFARRKFPGVSPIGQRLHIGPDSGPWFTVVGVVGDVKQTSLVDPPVDTVYIPAAQWRSPDRAMWVVARTGAKPAAIVPAIRDAVWSVDRQQAVLRSASMDDRIAASMDKQRFVMVLLGVFAMVALILATIGIYGVLAGSVTERTREIGLRSALGASPASILGMVLRQTMILTAAGLTGGVIVAGIASRGLRTLLFGISALDVVTYAGVITLLLAASVVGCLLPGWRAARIDPSIALQP